MEVINGLRYLRSRGSVLSTNTTEISQKHQEQKPDDYCGCILWFNCTKNTAFPPCTCWSNKNKTCWHKSGKTETCIFKAGVWKYLEKVQLMLSTSHWDWSVTISCV